MIFLIVLGFTCLLDFLIVELTFLSTYVEITVLKSLRLTEPKVEYMKLEVMVDNSVLLRFCW